MSQEGVIDVKPKFAAFQVLDTFFRDPNVTYPIPCIRYLNDAGQSMILVRNGIEIETNNADRVVIYFLGTEVGENSVRVALDAKRFIVKRFSQADWLLFNREMANLLRCNTPGHDNVIRVVDALATTTADNAVHYFIVTEYHGDDEGPVNLRQINTRPDYTLNSDQIHFIFRQVIHGLYYLHHDKNLVHMELTAKNIPIITSTGQCKIADLETSETFPSGGWNSFEEYREYLLEFYNVHTTLNNLDGYTFPPEMLFSKFGTAPYHPAQQDVWSAGVLLLELITRGSNLFVLGIDGTSGATGYENSGFFNLLLQSEETVARWFRQNFAYLEMNPARILSKMLKPYAAQRITVEDLMNEPYIKQAPNIMPPAQIA